MLVTVCDRCGDRICEEHQYKQIGDFPIFSRFRKRMTQIEYESLLKETAPSFLIRPSHAYENHDFACEMTVKLFVVKKKITLCPNCRRDFKKFLKNKGG